MNLQHFDPVPQTSLDCFCFLFFFFFLTAKKKTPHSVKKLLTLQSKLQYLLSPLQFALLELRVRGYWNCIVTYLSLSELPFINYLVIILKNTIEVLEVELFCST